MAIRSVRSMQMPLAAALAALMVAVMATTVQSQSLWTDNWNLYGDTKAKQIGDLVTIIISERSEASQSASTETDSSGEVSVGPGVGALQELIPLLRVSGEDASSASGSTTRGGELEARMTARVIEVLPNGNFFIEGRQNIVINEEDQEIVVSGIIRPDDIRPDNTILSTYVADAQIIFKGTGALGDKQKPGIITRIFDWLF